MPDPYHTGDIAHPEMHKAVWYLLPPPKFTTAQDLRFGWLQFALATSAAATPSGSSKSISTR
jgi:hypothetical protein